MKLSPMDIYDEYTAGVQFKSSLGSKGIYEQSRINERFYIGDQWHGAKCGNERPLVRHNIIKRIGDFKMSQILSAPLSVSYSADGVPNTAGNKGRLKQNKKEISQNPMFSFAGEVDDFEINTVMSALSDYRDVTAERVGFSSLAAKALRNAFVSGSGVIYTYWDSQIDTGLYAADTDTAAIRGDIACEVLNIENVYFGDPYIEQLEAQPYIIISSHRSATQVKREAAAFGADETELELIGNGDENGKVLVLTRLYKEYGADGKCTVKCIKATENAFVRRSFDTNLRLYPLSIFRWDERNNLVYGESEITYLIPNQIAINRMITANVWAAMTMGMPLMVVNGDTVSGDITNDPGQIIKIFGSNEDVAGAIKYVSPPDFSGDFSENINQLIENTLTQSGANEVALGDSRPDNAAALKTMRDAATEPLQLLKNRFFAFVEDVSRVWSEFWVTQYGNRRIKIHDENGVWYMPFSAERYKRLIMSARVDVGSDTAYSTAQRLAVLSELYDKGIIDKRQYIKRLPAGTVSDTDGLLNALDDEEEKANDGV